MSGALESAADAGALLHPSLTDGLEQITSGEEVEFIAYRKFVLPLDGSVFWVKGASFSVEGSLHYAADRRLNEDETAGIDRVLFTSPQEITSFNKIDADFIYIGHVNDFRFAFASRGSLFRNASLFHYQGQSVNPALESQLLDSVSQIDPDVGVVSNSLPIWLDMQAYAPIWLDPPNPNVPLYASFLVPENIVPPYGSVHIEPSQTRALQATPWLSSHSSHSQLAYDRVRITLYGLNNSRALDFLDLTLQYIRDNDGCIGLMSTPIVRDDKRPQVEIKTLAMKKIIDFEVSYNQTRLNDIARAVIEQACASFVPPSGA